MKLQPVRPTGKDTYLHTQVARFIHCHASQRDPLFLGLSGGPDSMALFYLLLSQKYPFEVAHVDHGWREESMQEVLDLAQLCSHHQIPFHFKRLTSFDPTRNREDQGRQARLAFFKALADTRGWRGVFLAHHADDQAETVIKRVLEGASLPKLRGLQPVTQVEGILLFRPLLSVRKKQLLDWLDEQHLPYFLDPTNHESSFLRARLRDTLLPMLTAQFGKEITQSLCRLGNSAAELAEFIEHTLIPYREKTRATPSGISLNFSFRPPTNAFLWKVVLRDFFERQKLSLSHAHLEMILFHLLKKNSTKKVAIQTHWLLIQGQEITLLLEK